MSNEAMDQELMQLVNGGKEEATPYINIEAVKRKPEPKHRRHPVYQVILDTFGYIGMGAFMLTAMVLDVLPWWGCVPAFVGCFLYVALRVDRMIRR